jgi:hypothetical protein
MADEYLNASSRGFLARAQLRFAEAAPEALLYGALDLRLGIEARYHEFLDAAEEVNSLKRRGWRIADLARDLEGVFQIGETIASVSLLEGPDKKVTKTFYYTPIARQTRGIAERLGDYLHVTDRFRPRDEKWRTGLRTLIDEGIAGLRASTTGTLLAPPLWKVRGKEATLLLEVIGGGTFEQASKMIGNPGDSINLRVDYHATMPDEAIE